MESQEDLPFETLEDLEIYTRTLVDLADLLISKAFSAETRRFRRGKFCLLLVLAMTLLLYVVDVRHLV